MIWREGKYNPQVGHACCTVVSGTGSIVVLDSLGSVARKESKEEETTGEVVALARISTTDLICRRSRSVLVASLVMWNGDFATALTYLTSRRCSAVTAFSGNFMTETPYSRVVRTHAS